MEGGVCILNTVDLLLILHDRIVALEKEKQGNTEDKQDTQKD